MTENITRQPQGIPTGGQFAAVAHAEPDLSLAVPARPVETLRTLRGHDFYPPAEEMAKWPKLYSTEDVAVADKPIQAHYFQGGMDWYITEYDPKENEAFGYVDLGLGHPEWGYIPLDQVEELRGQMGLPIERDLDFVPGTTAKECIPRYKADAAAAGDKAAMDDLQNQAVDAILRDLDEDREWEPRFDGPDEPDPLSPEDREQWDRLHRFAYDYGHSVLGVTGFETRDKIERFAGFAANAYMECGWDLNMDMHSVVDDWMAQEHPLG